MQGILSTGCKSGGYDVGASKKLGLLPPDNILKLLDKIHVNRTKERILSAFPLTKVSRKPHLSSTIVSTF